MNVGKGGYDEDNAYKLVFLAYSTRGLPAVTSGTAVLALCDQIITNNFKHTNKCQYLHL